MLSPLRVIQWLTSMRIEKNIGTCEVITYLSQRIDNKNNNLQQFKWTATNKPIIESQEICHFQNQFPIRTLPRTNPIPLKTLNSQYIKTPDFTTYQQQQPKTAAILLGPGTLDTPFVMDKTDHLGLYVSYRKRLIPLRNKIDEQKLIRLGLFVNKWLQQQYNNKLLQPLPFLEDKRKQLTEQWLDDNKNYTLPRKRQLLTTYDKMFQHHNERKKLTEKDYVCKSFIKDEFYEEPKCSRFINSRTDRFKIRVAPFVSKVEEQMYRIKYFVKNIDVRKLPHSLIKLRKYKYILETDYTSFESSFDPRYTDQVECQLWRFMFKNNPTVLDDVMRCYYNTRTKDGLQSIRPRIEKLVNKKYHARCTGARMSGEMWTSLANGFSNLMNMLFLAEEHDLKVDGFVEGDDGLFGMDEIKITPEDFESLGFKIKMKYNETLHNTNFCGNYFDETELNSLIPPEQITRFFWTSSQRYFKSSKTIKDELMRCKAMSMFIQGKHTPIAAVLAYKTIQLLGPGKQRYERENIYWTKHIDDLAKDEKFELIPITWKSRVLYQELYNITVQEQLMAEQLLMKATSLDQLYLPMHFTKFNWVGTTYQN
jgi:hypothetical protein